MGKRERRTRRAVALGLALVMTMVSSVSALAGGEERYHTEVGEKATDSGLCAPRIWKDDTGSGSAMRVTFDLVKFGNYYQDLKFETKTPIKWRILSIEDGKALLFSDQVLDCIDNTREEDATWKGSAARTWLNGTFYNTAFTGTEQSAIQETVVHTEDRKVGSDTLSGGDDTLDRVFLLSQNEVKKAEYGFPTTNQSQPSSFDSEMNKERRVYSTRYAISRGTYRMNYIREYRDVRDGYTYYYLRDIGSDAGKWAGVSADGHVVECDFKSSYHGKDKYFGIRPALWVDLSSAAVTNAGTVDTEGNVTEPQSGQPYADPVKTTKTVTTSSGDPKNITVTTWNCVYFGSYYQEPEKEPITWRVLDVKNNRAFLLADRVLENKPYGSSTVEGERTKWSNCELRSWLNDDFLQAAFTQEEQEKIAVTSLQGVDRSQNIFLSQTDWEYASEDKIFLPSYYDLIKDYQYNSVSAVKAYGGQYGMYLDLQAKATAFAKLEWLEMGEDEEADYCNWLTRTLGKGNDYACTVCTDGDFENGYEVSKKILGIRPALWLDLSSNAWVKCGIYSTAGENVEKPLKALEEHAYTAPYCNNDTRITSGALAYYKDPDVHLYYADPDREQEIDAGTWKIENPRCDYGDWTVTKEPTTTETGSKQRVCKRCGHAETIDLPKVDAEGKPLLKMVEKIPATCCEAGNNLYYLDEATGKYYKNAAGTNEYANEGWIIKAYGTHKWGDWEILQHPTYKLEGIKMRTCTAGKTGTINYSHSEYVLIPKLGSTDEEKVLTHMPAKVPLCEEDGQADYYLEEGSGRMFTRAGGWREIASTDDLTPLPAIGHKYPEYYSDVVYPTKDLEGLQKRVCGNNPGHVDYRLSPKTGSTDPYVTLIYHEAKEPTETEAGNTPYFEDAQGHRFYDYIKNTNWRQIGEDSWIIPATGQSSCDHTYGPVSFFWAQDYSTCTAKRVCTKDEGHIRSFVCEVTKRVKEPTCTEEGFTTYTASVKIDGETASDQKIDNKVAPSGHEWETGYTVDKQPTATESGIKSIHCKKCGAKKDEQKIDPIGGGSTVTPGGGSTVTPGGGGKEDPLPDAPETSYKADKKEQGKKKTVRVPDTIIVNGVTYKVTSLAGGALANEKKAKLIILGKYIESVPGNAVKGCKKLKSLKITNTEKMVKFSKKSFAGVKGKLKLQVPRAFYAGYKAQIKRLKLTKKIKLKKY